jgi:hypothetical protein
MYRTPKNASTIKINKIIPFTFSTRLIVAPMPPLLPPPVSVLDPERFLLVM